METRPLGNTGEKVSVIGLGSGFLNQHSYTDGVDTVKRALDLGVSYFDTSPLYGQGTSQAIFGEALQDRSEPFVLATKLGHFSQPASFRAPAALSAQLDDNLRLLRREHIDVLQVHEADWRAWWSEDDRPPGSGALSNPGWRRGHLDPNAGYLLPDHEYDFASAPIMQYLRDARRQGRCRYIGITGNTADNVARVLRDVDVDTVLIAFNYDLIWRRTRTHALPLARESGSAMLLAAVLHNTHLPGNHPEWEQSPPQWMSKTMKARLDTLSKLQRESGMSLVELTIRFLLADKSVSTILVGASQPSEIEASVAAARAGKLPPDLHDALEQLGVEEPQPFF